ncbi:MAG TPA: hypothetical protein VGE74_30295 [Gemmata sp.]
MKRYRKWLFAALLATGTAAGTVEAQPPFPTPAPLPVESPIDGPWYFRGDPWKPCYIRTVNGPRGPALLFTNEKGSDALGYLSRDGRRVTIPDWNLTGTIRRNAIVWPNGDFWGR